MTKQEKKELKKHSDFRRLCKPIKVLNFRYHDTDKIATFETLNDYFNAIVNIGIPNSLSTMALPIFQHDLPMKYDTPAKSLYYCISPSGVILVYEFYTSDLDEGDKDE